jgi:hypothetical protein
MYDKIARENKVHNFVSSKIREPGKKARQWKSNRGPIQKSTKQDSRYVVSSICRYLYHFPFQLFEPMHFVCSISLPSIAKHSQDKAKRHSVNYLEFFGSREME